MKIVVDTNIVFSGILNSNSTIGKLLIRPKPHFEFYACDFLKAELLKHKSKLIKLTRLKALELEELQYLVTANITFINETIISEKILLASEKLLKDIDSSDTPHLALTKLLKAKLWTGDKKLINGLKAKKFKSVITTAELSKLFDILENKKQR